ncbi:MAG: TetM/TetW/TetO/TetS family tetracycline resistance ribosomal protection protein [Eubacteriales bacterium]|nr:TetM/TetW/TetO/TetS family tetracycline resistance ribosomal protection protein [Eubacteriales bacterium]
MGEAKPEKVQKHICAGLLAHVDAGKTTLAEAILYRAGRIRRLGRVDHQDAFLDTDAMERARGITIFSKQARLTLGDYEVTLLDTPGHVDFSAEMERTLQVLDYAVLVISGADGVQGHVETLWRLLGRYQVPVFLFINKMDQPGTDEGALLRELQKRLDPRCVCVCGMPRQADAETGAETGAGADGELSAAEDFWENAAVCDEGLLERYLEGEQLSWADIAALVQRRELFPCFFGSALKVCGVDRLLLGLRLLMEPKPYSERFGARVFKITRDGQGNRLTHMKITGGSLRVKQTLTNGSAGGEAGTGVWEEKVDQIRLYDGSSFDSVKEAESGQICAVSGLFHTFAGEGLGAETEPVLPVLEPVLTYRVELPEGCDPHRMLRSLKQLEEEEPELSIVWEEATGEICAQVMGEVQIDVLRAQIRERFGVAVSFGEGSIVYRETIEGPVEGVGHFEPLRHYAEVHLLLEPLERGAGLQFASACSEDVLDRSWQRLVLTHLEEKRHRGVLTGAEITDMKVTLLTGRAHLKHTEGGDFRQATWRALRQGLMRAKSVLLEPVYAFRLELPAESVGRAMTDLQRMCAVFSQPVREGEATVLTGTAPVACMGGYQKEVTSYTKGRGRLTCTLQGYAPCHNAEEVIAAAAYDPEADLENTPSSVFCAHGAGFVVPWDQVEEYMHLESGYAAAQTAQEQGQEENGLRMETNGLRMETETGGRGVPAGRRPARTEAAVSEEELREIFQRTYGSAPRERSRYKKRRAEDSPAASRLFERQRKNPDRTEKGAPAAAQEEYLLVDGYNIIFAWETLRELAKVNIESARNLLMDVLCNYQGFCRCTLILVFDAYRVEGGQGSVQRYHNIHVVFTREAETADQYIEKTVHKIGRGARVTVATSDALEQVIIYGQGARRMSARELLEEVERTRELILEQIGRDKDSQESGGQGRNYLFDHLPAELAEYMEQVRLGKREL